MGSLGTTSNADRLTAVLKSDRLHREVFQELAIASALTQREWEKARQKRPTYSIQDLDRVALELVHAYPELVVGVDEENPERGILSLSDEALQRRLNALEGLTTGEATPAELETVREEWYRKLSETFQEFKELMFFDQTLEGTLVVEARFPEDPQMAAAIANRFVARLKAYLDENSFSQAHRVPTLFGGLYSGLRGEATPL
ncbi:MAG: hypothetical protein KatS3mg115_0820 [Candidatus Poribacteria bacterium]|nr:MAG: hypothetical protein KatS3mg115_0820 [Candidatus Poribacteria bacterium]